jgi:hypothetical protein
VIGIDVVGDIAAVLLLNHVASGVIDVGDGAGAGRRLAVPPLPAVVDEARRCR